MDKEPPKERGWGWWGWRRACPWGCRREQGPCRQGRFRCPVWRTGLVAGVSTRSCCARLPCVEEEGGLKDQSLSLKLSLKAEEVLPAAPRLASSHPLPPSTDECPLQLWALPQGSRCRSQPDTTRQRWIRAVPGDGVVCVCVGKPGCEWRRAQTAREAESGRAPLPRQRSMGDGRFGVAGWRVLPRALPQ